MKPLQLKITGLNSFRQTEIIDFEQLMADGLFGVFGPTGSGKSSILDGITLALYGRIRRAHGGKSGIINMREKSCAVSFSFQSGDGYGGCRNYIVERTFGHSRNGGVETRRVRLISEENGERVPLTEKQSELDELIAHEIIGIDLDDFFRAVVLPQGAFADFLFLTPKDRATALQRLFGLHDLGQRLTIRVRSLAGDLRLQRAALDARLDELNRYNDEALSLCEAEAGSAEEYCVATRVVLEDARKRYEESKDLHELLEEFAALSLAEDDRPEREQRLEKLRRRIGRDEQARLVEPAIAMYEAAKARHAEVRREYELAVQDRTTADEKLTAARELLARVSEAFKSYEETNNEIARLEAVAKERNALTARSESLQLLGRQLASAIMEADEKEGEQQRLAREVEEITDRITATEQLLEEVTIGHDERELLGELDRMVRELKRRSEELAARREAVEDLQRELEQKKKLHEQVEREERTSSATVARHENEFASARQLRASLDKQREKLRDLYSMVMISSERLASYEERRARVEKHLREVCVESDNIAKQRVEVERRRSIARTDETAAYIEFTALSEKYVAARNDQSLALLAGHLHDGEPCPLCGSVSHPQPFVAGDVQNDLKLIEARRHEAELKLRAESQRVREIELEHAAIIAQGEAKDDLLAKADAAVRAVREELAGLLVGIREATGLETPAELADREKEIDSEITTVVSDLAVLDTRIEAIHNELQTARSSQRENVSRRVAIDTAIEGMNERISKLTSEESDLCSAWEGAVQVFLERSNGRPIEEVERLIEESGNRTREADRLNDALKRLREQCAERTVRSRQADAGVIAAREKKARIEADHRTLKKGIDDTLIAIQCMVREIVPKAEQEKPVEKLIAERRTTVERLKRDHDDAKQRYDEASNHDKLVDSLLDDRWKQLCAAERDRDTTERDCTSLLHEQGFDTVDDARSVLLNGSDRARLKQDAETLTEELRQNELRRVRLVERINGRTITDDELAACREGYATATDEHEAAVGAARAAGDRLKECRERNSEWRQLARDNEDLLQETSTVDQLARYLHGDGFVNFIANERLAGVCARASHGLLELTGGRLELDSRHDDGFIIRDNGNGGYERSPSTLSGGETFLVSLSLAIALSDTIQLGRAPLEFFFLDEGFGTLDAELLDSVMTSLEQLRSQHRAIGVITHVAALRERIARRLIVTPPSEHRGSTIAYEVE